MTFPLLQAGVRPAARSDFVLQQPRRNEAMIALIESLEGPQEVELELEVKMYRNGIYSGKSIAYVNIVVTEYEF